MNQELKKTEKEIEEHFIKRLENNKMELNFSIISLERKLEEIKINSNGNSN
jgi:hypothetical protein